MPSFVALLAIIGTSEKKKDVNNKSMTDVEAERQPLNNPYRNGLDNVGLDSPRHPYNLLKRVLIISASLYGLDHFKVYHTVMHSPDVRHEWFKIGLAASIGKPATFSIYVLADHF